jgi:hypothetical protein
MMINLCYLGCTKYIVHLFFFKFFFFFFFFLIGEDCAKQSLIELFNVMKKMKNIVFNFPQVNLEVSGFLFLFNFIIFFFIFSYHYHTILLKFLKI